jgi:hypothetical protein
MAPLQRMTRTAKTAVATTATAGSKSEILAQR